MYIVFNWYTIILRPFFFSFAQIPRRLPPDKLQRNLPQKTEVFDLTKPKREYYSSHAPLFWWIITREQPITNHKAFSDFYHSLSRYISFNKPSNIDDDSITSFLCSQNALNRQFQKLVFSFHSSNKLASSIFSNLPMRSGDRLINLEQIEVSPSELDSIVAALGQNYKETGYALDKSPAHDELRKNVRALLIHCKASAELSCIAPLYIFLHSVNTPLYLSNFDYPFCDAKGTPTEYSPYQLIRSVRKQFRDRNAYNHQKQAQHIRWFYNIYTAMNPVLPLQQWGDELYSRMPYNQKLKFEKFLPATDSYPLLLPIPMYENFLRSIKERFSMTEEQLDKLSQIVYCNDPDREDRLQKFKIGKEPIGEAISKLEFICSPTHYYNYKTCRTISPKAKTQYKNALYFLMPFLLPSSDPSLRSSNPNLKEGRLLTDEEASYILDLLKNQLWIFYEDANLLGFWRLTKYVPDPKYFDGFAPPSATATSIGLNNLLSRELLSLRMVCGVQQIPTFIPNPETFQKASEMRFLIYQNWDKKIDEADKTAALELDSDKFWSQLIPSIYQNAYISDQLDHYTSSSNDIETTIERIQTVSSPAKLQKCRKIDRKELLPHEYTGETASPVSADSQQLLCAYVLRFLSMHAIDTSWSSNPAFEQDFIFYHCFEECFLQASRVFNSKFWNYLYSYADSLFPLQDAFSKVSTEKRSPLPQIKKADSIR